jgi:hypothetical protein
MTLLILSFVKIGQLVQKLKLQKISHAYFVSLREGSEVKDYELYRLHPVVCIILAKRYPCNRP